MEEMTELWVIHVGFYLFYNQYRSKACIVRRGQYKFRTDYIWLSPSISVSTMKQRKSGAADMELTLTCVSGGTFTCGYTFLTNVLDVL